MTPRSSSIDRSGPRSSNLRVPTTRSCAGRSSRCWRTGRRPATFLKCLPWMSSTSPGTPNESGPLAEGTRLGPYQIAGLLGKGGMGEVYGGTDTRLGPPRRYQNSSRTLAADPQRRERFLREARAVSSLNHPHICKLFDVGEQDGIHYLVMERVEGETLAARLEKGKVPLIKLSNTPIQIADALDKAHRQGVVHRDLKPANIMVTSPGRSCWTLDSQGLESGRQQPNSPKSPQRMCRCP